MPIKARYRHVLLAIALFSLINSNPTIAQETDENMSGAASSCVEFFLSADQSGTTVLASTVSPSDTRQRYRPVTFTQAGWHKYGPTLLYNGWRYAFSNFQFYGKTRRNYMFVGGRHTIGIDGSTASITRLINSIPQTGQSGKLMRDYACLAGTTEAGALAGEVIALTLNIAFNDMRLMPRHPGYDLEKFTISRGYLRGYTVGRVLDIANRILGGDSPLQYGFTNYQALTDLLKEINSDYEFIDYNTFIERGFLIMNRPYGQPDPPHNPHVP